MPERIKPITLDGLDDLAQDETFTFKGKEYTIPAISQQTAEALAVLTKNVRVHIDEENAEEVLKWNTLYISTAMGECDEKKVADAAKMVSKWPVKVTNHLCRFIATTMQGPVDEVIPEEEKEAAKK